MNNRIKDLIKVEIKMTVTVNSLFQNLIQLILQQKLWAKNDRARKWPAIWNYH